MLLKQSSDRVKVQLTKQCLNCNMPVQKMFCSTCGQRTEVKRIDGKEVLHEILHFFTHLQKNFLNTSYEMLLRPQVVQHNYLKGQRKKYHNPFSYLVIWVALEWIVKNWVIWRFGYKLTVDPSKSPSYAEAMIYFGNPTYLLVAIIIPVVAFISYLILSRGRFNFFETLILVFYSYGTYNILLLLGSDILLGVVFNGNIISWQVTYVNLALGGIWSSWNIYQFYKDSRLRYFWVKLTVAVLLINSIVFYIISYMPVVSSYLSHKVF